MRMFLVGAGLVVMLTVAAGAWHFLAGPPDVKVLTADEKAACGLSVSATEGPYYVSGTTALKDNNLNFTGLPGTPLALSGHVYDGLDAKPIANAKIEIWQADSAGSYHPNSNGDAANEKPEDIGLRGFIITDADGAYHFTTIYPGEYTGRTRHMHFKITAGAKSLTTQLIIPSLSGDKLTFDNDTIAQGLPACALLKFNTTTTPESATFDFRL